MSKKGIKFDKNSKVQQHAKDLVGQKNVALRMARGQVMPDPGKPMFLDLYDAPTFHESMNIVTRVQQDFEKVPSKIRKRFHNNPMEVLEFCQEQKNAKEAFELGLTQTDPEAKKAEETKKTEEVKTEQKSEESSSTPKEEGA